MVSSFHYLALVSPPSSHGHPNILETMLDSDLNS